MPDNKNILNTIQFYTIVKTYGKISRYSWSRLWYLCRGVDPEGQGRVVVSLEELKVLLCCSRSSIYRWLREGRENGAFRDYRRRGFFVIIYMGSLRNVCKTLKLNKWGSVTEVPLWEILSDDPDHQGIKQFATLHQTQQLQTRSKAAAVKSARYKKDKRRLAKIDFRRATETNQSCQFFRHSIPIGVSQEAIATSLEISERQVRRHLAANKVQRVQAFYKVPKKEGEAELFFDREARKKSKIFYRKGEYWRFGTNQYDLKFEQKTQWIAQIKYKWNLLKVFRARPEDQTKIAYIFEEFGSRLDYLKLIECKNFLEFKKTLTREIRQANKNLGGDP